MRNGVCAGKRSAYEADSGFMASGYAFTGQMLKDAGSGMCRGKSSPPQSDANDHHDRVMVCGARDVDLAPSDQAPRK